MTNIDLVTQFPNGVGIWGPLTGGPGVPLLPNADISYFGEVWFVDTVNGSDGNNGHSPSQAFKTMGRAFYVDYAANGANAVQPNLNANSTIFFVGVVREQLVAPLLGRNGQPLTGVSIVGMANGGVRDDNGAKWTYPASGAVAAKALLSLKQQGWAVANFLMTPEPGGSGGACVELNRQETPTVPDSSHFIASGMRFVGVDVTTTYGIRDIGGCSNVQVLNCEFYLLTTGLWCSSTAIAIPLRWLMLGNRFFQNTNDIIVPSTLAILRDNVHTSAAATEKVEISGGAGSNTVTGCTFPNAAADIDPANGYDGEASDVWAQNFATDQAVFGNPA